MTRAVRKATREWGVIAALGFLTTGIIVLFMLLIPALGRISTQAKAGQQAKHRQCVVVPISEKLYRDARRRHVITAGDLARFRRSAEQLGCPAVKK